MKKWSKLVLATMVSAGTLLVSGCIENLEPEGIADLRGAKAELLRAQTALQAAQAAKVEADAALVLAQAKVQEAIAKQEEAKVAFIEAQTLAEQYRAEYQKLVNEAFAQESADEHAKKVQELEEKIAAHEREMAEAEMAAALAAEEFKLQMLDVMAQLAKAQLTYDQALLDIELARNTLTDEQNNYLNGKELAFRNAQSEVLAKTRALEDAADFLAEAIATVDEAEAKDVLVRGKMREIAKLQAELEGLIEAQAEAEELMNLDPDLTDWDAEREELEEEIAKLEKEMQQILREISDKIAESTAELKELQDKIELYEGTTGYELDLDLTNDDPETWGTGLFKKKPGAPSLNIAVPEIAVPLPEFLGGAPFFTLTAADYSYGKEDAVYDEFDAAVAQLNMMLNYTLPLNEKMLASMKELVDAMPEDETYVKNLEEYNDMVAAYKSGDYTAYANKYVYNEENSMEGAFEEAVTGYNEALKAFEAAWTACKTAVETTNADAVKLEQLYADKTSAESDAYAAKMKAYQAAQDEHDKAYQKYLAADYAHQAAERKRDNAIESVLATLVEEFGFAYGSAADVTKATDDMNSFKSYFDAAYATPPVDGDPDYDQYVDEKKKYDAYVAALADIAKAQTAYNDEDDDTLTDPYSIWEKAKADYLAAQAKQSDANVAADNKWNEAVAEADRVYNEALNTYMASLPNLVPGYKTYLEDIVADSLKELLVTISTLNTVSNSFYTALDPSEVGDFLVVEYVAEFFDKINGVQDDITLTLSSVPFYLVDKETETLKEIKTDDIVALYDKDVMLDEITKHLENYLFNVYVYAYGSSLTMPLAAVLCDDYPLSYPTYEDFLAYYEVSPTVSLMDENGNPLTNPVGVAQYYMAKVEIKDLEDMFAEADVEAVKAAVAGIEAAKKEFEAYVAEKEAELDALKAEIEEAVPALLEEVKTFVAENTALENKYDVLIQKLQNLNQIVAYYCSATDPNHTADNLKDLVEELKKNYDNAVEDVAYKEDLILKAEVDLQMILDGYADAVTLAQRAFEDAEIALEEAQKALDKATEELEKALELIYGDEELPEDPAPEDPAPEDPAPEDPGTGDEGGEEETPAA